METIQKQELGEFYKELRIARKRKQKDVAREGLSVSQLSKFENGQSMLSADKLLIAIEGINMTFSEFGHALRGYQNTDFINKGQEITTLFNHQDKDSLEKRLSVANTVYDKLMNGVIYASLLILDPTYSIPSGQKEFLVYYLYEIEHWTEFEFYIFCNSTSLLSNEDLIFLSRELLKKSQYYANLACTKRYIKMNYLNLVSDFIDRKEYDYADLFSKELKKLLSYEDTFQCILLDFLDLYLKLIKGEISREQVEEYIKKVEELKLYVLKNLMLNKLD